MLFGDWSGHYHYRKNNLDSVVTKSIPNYVNLTHGWTPGFQWSPRSPWITWSLPWNRWPQIPLSPSVSMEYTESTDSMGSMEFIMDCMVQGPSHLSNSATPPNDGTLQQTPKTTGLLLVNLGFFVFHTYWSRIELFCFMYWDQNFSGLTILLVSYKHTDVLWFSLIHLGNSKNFSNVSWPCFQKFRLFVFEISKFHLVFQKIWVHKIEE